jgi:hypothetical protein
VKPPQLNTTSMCVLLSVTRKAEWPNNEYNSSPGPQVITLIRVCALLICAFKQAEKIKLNKQQKICFMKRWL